MRRKIFNNYLLVGALVTLLCCVLFAAVLFRYYENQAFARLASEADFVAQGMELTGEDYLENLAAQDRVTWVDTDGTVLYDTQANPAEMENHLDREEISQALASGSGQSVHYSETLLERNLYYALSLGDGTVVRVSCTQSSVLALLLALVWPVVGVLVIAAVLCILLAFRLARAIVKPINQIDLDRPMVDEVYGELHPLVERIREQNRTIRSQMDELSRRQREFAALTENMGEGFLLLDDKTNVLHSNPSAVALLGDGHLENLRRDGKVPQALTTVEAALAGVRSETIQDIGGTSWQIIANPVVANGQVAGAAVILMDVTEREQREALRREFSANVSHELKTPLTSITGFAELMMEGLVPEHKVPEFAADIHRESERLIHLVDDTLRLSKLEESGDDVTMEEVDLYDLSDEILANLRPIADKQKVSLHLTGDHASINGIWQVLNEMVYNLCDNGIKYNKPGGSVTVSVRKEGERITLTVQDTGIGIPYTDQGRVFERFYRVDKSHSKEVGGTGLGLSIVKHAAQAHNAEVSLTSTPGQGTCVTVRF